MADKATAEAEKAIKRNPHPDFKSVEASRPPWSPPALTFTQTALPTWTLGSGANDSTNSSIPHRQIDPYAPGRPAALNYKLLISAITPRPIGFVGTRSKDGASTNLAPFSYFNVANHDPPIFTLGFSGSVSSPKDSLRNLLDTREASINIISEHFLEAANATSINAPYGVSEWTLSGLTPADCKDVSAPRVKEAIFSIEVKLLNTQEFESRATPGKVTGVLAVLEGVNFWVREDAVNEEGSLVDPAVLRPVSRLGGITYGRTIEAVELPRPDFEKEIKGFEHLLGEGKK